MKTLLDLNRISRNMIAPFLDNYTLDQLNTIPTGFSNSIFWNIAHVVVTQQLLVYHLSGLPMLIADEWVTPYRKGTKPEQQATLTQLHEIKTLLFETINQTETDYKNGVFAHFSEYPTSTGYVLQTVEQAMSFNNFHEGVHLGVMASIRKML